MRITCEVDGLKAALGIVSRAVPQRTPKPILACVKLTVSEAGSTIEATNLEFSIRSPLSGCRAVDPGVCLLPAALLGEILKSTGDAGLSIESDGVTTLVAGLAAEWELPTEAPDLYPVIPPFPGGPTIVIAASDFLHAIKRTVYAVDEKSSRYALGGCLAEFGDGAFGLTAADGRQLAHCEAPATGNAESDVDHQRVIPARSLRDLLSILDESGEVELAFPDRSWCHARAGGLEAATRLVEGRFPRWRDILPPPPSHRLAVTVGPFRAAIEQAALVRSDESSGIDFAFGPGRLTLAGKSEGKGKSKVVFPVEYDGPDFAFYLDPKYLAGPLKAFPSDSVLSLEIGGPKDGIVLRTEGFIHTCMPMVRE